MIKTQELKPGLSLKTSKTKTSEKIDKMLKKLTKIKIEKGETSTVNVLHKNDKLTVETYSSNSETTSDEEIDKLEKAFGKLQRITNKKPQITHQEERKNIFSNLTQRPTKEQELGSDTKRGSSAYI